MANKSVTSGILTDYNGNPFLPRTTFSQVFKDDTGVSLASCVWPVSNGGTGRATHTLNSVLVGNNSSTIKNIASASGAFYATSANGEPKFGTLPIGQGGTGATTAAAAQKNLLDGMELSTVAITDESQLVFKYTTPTPEKGTLLYKNASTLRNYLFNTTANRALYISSNALTASSHYMNASKLAINSTSEPSYNFYINGTSGFYNGHLYLTGAVADSSTSNTTQLVFGTPGGEGNVNNHVAVSSNTNALIINPTISSTTNQIVLYTDNTKTSLIPSSLSTGPLMTTGALSITGTGTNALLAFTSDSGTISSTGDLTLTHGSNKSIIMDNIAINIEGTCPTMRPTTAYNGFIGDIWTPFFGMVSQYFYVMDPNGGYGGFISASDNEASFALDWGEASVSVYDTEDDGTGVYLYGDTITVTGNIVPRNGESLNLGSNELIWNNIHTHNMYFYNSNSANQGRIYIEDSFLRIDNGPYDDFCCITLGGGILLQTSAIDQDIELNSAGIFLAPGTRGLRLTNNIYGTLAERDQKFPTPVEGQVFFVIE